MTPDDMTRAELKALRERKRISFMPVLDWICRRRCPETVLEWGPGDSTVRMAELCHDARFLCIEHNPAWFKKTRVRVDRFANVELVIRAISLKGGKSQGYVTYPALWAEDGPDSSPFDAFDLIFIDGRFRYDCLNFARLALCSETTIVVIHDIRRRNYWPAILAYPDRSIYREIDTAVLSLSAVGKTTMEGFPHELAHDFS